MQINPPFRGGINVTSLKQLTIVRFFFLIYVHLKVHIIIFLQGDCVFLNMSACQTKIK